MNPSIHTPIIHPFIHPHTHSLIMHPSIHPPHTHSPIIHPFIHPPTHSLTPPSIHPPTHTLNHPSSIHSSIHPHTHSPFHPFIHLSTNYFDLGSIIVLVSSLFGGMLLVSILVLSFYFMFGGLVNILTKSTKKEFLCRVCMLSVSCFRHTHL